MALSLWRMGETGAALDAVEAAIAINPEAREDFRADGQFAPFRQNERFRALVSGA